MKRNAIIAIIVALSFIATTFAQEPKKDVKIKTNIEKTDKKDIKTTKKDVKSSATQTQKIGTAEHKNDWIKKPAKTPGTKPVVKADKKKDTPTK